MRIVLIGAGNLATHFGKALCDAHHEVVQVYSRTIGHAQLLADLLHVSYTDSIDQLVRDVDCYVFAVKDQVLPTLIKEVSCLHADSSALFVHTAGSIPIDVFPEEMKSYGVLYPMQTFSKERAVSFAHLPIFLEATDESTLSLAETLARSISDNVRPLSSDQRRYLHLAAVFACNFVNHCYALSAEILQRHDIPFDVMQPLIDETAEKIKTLSPREAQTGPAVRYDENVINAQMDLLRDDPSMQELYALMSKSIHQFGIDTLNR